jgi:hypothetical protein
MDNETKGITAYKCKSCPSMISSGFYCSECSDTPSGESNNYQRMWEKGLLVFDKVVKQLNHIEEQNELLRLTVEEYKKTVKLLTDNTEGYKKILKDNDIEVLG